MIKRWIHRAFRWSVSLGHWAERRFTPVGVMVLMGSLVTAGLGVNIEQSVAYQASVLLGCCLLVAMCCAPFFRGHFVIQRALPRFGTVGDKMSYSLTIKNLSSKDRRGLRMLEDPAGLRPSLEEFWETLRFQDWLGTRSFRLTQSSLRQRSVRIREHPVASLPAGGETTLHATLTPLRRGVLSLEGVTLLRSDPFGLFNGCVKVARRDSVVILPRRYPVPEIQLAGTQKYQPVGMDLASSVGDSEEFIALREYRRGDPVRHLHWKSWAKTGKPIVKEFQDEFFVRHALILDTFADADPGPVFEEAVSVAASFACTLQTQESLLDLLFVGPEAFCFTTGRGLGQTEQLLEILAAVRVCRDQPFTALRKLVGRHQDLLSGCVCVFLAWDEPRRQLIDHLTQAGLPLLVLVIVGPDQALALDPGPMRSQPGRFRVLEVGKIAEGLARDFS